MNHRGNRAWSSGRGQRSDYGVDSSAVIAQDENELNYRSGRGTWRRGKVNLCAARAVRIHIVGAGLASSKNWVVINATRRHLARRQGNNVVNLREFPQAVE